MRRARITACIAVLTIIGALAVGWHWRDELAVRLYPLGWLKSLTHDSNNENLAAWADAIISTRSQRRLRAELPRILVELQNVSREVASAPDHEWAGTYIDDGGREIHLTASGRFAFRAELSPGCFSSGPPLQRWNDGGIDAISPQRLLLRPTIDPRLPDFDCPTELIRIRWRECPLLVKPDYMPYFCLRVNTGVALDAVTWTYRRKGQRFSHTTELPDVPAEFRQYLIPTPIQTRLIAIEKNESTDADWSPSITVARFDRGSEHGLIEGTELFRSAAASPGGVLRPTATITRLFPHECVAEFRRFRSDGDAYESPEVGWVYTTRDPSYRDESQYQLLDERVAADLNPQTAASLFPSDDDGKVESQEGDD